MNFSENFLTNPIMLAADVDSADECLRLATALEGKIGAIKVGPRLVVRHGGSFIQKLSEKVPVFVDNKYLDIPSTMEGAVRASFAVGATFTTVHAWSGPEALELLAKVERELNQIRPFRILVVTILTSFSERSLPPGLSPQPVASHVDQLAALSMHSGLKGLVCSPQEVGSLRRSFPDSYLVTPGVRMPTDALGDQKRVETPAAAIALGASAIVIGRPIYEAKDPVEATERILKNIREAKT